MKRNKELTQNEKNQMLVHEAYEKAAEVLEHCLSPIGMKASARTYGYPQVWARDSMITLFGASLLPDKKITAGLKKSLLTLSRYQTALGLIPNNVPVESKKVNFQAYMDGGLWFIIGSSVFYEEHKDKVFLRKMYRNVKKALEWYAYQEVDQSGLLSMQESADWEDLFATRGKGLYVNTLYYQALLAAARIAVILGRKNEGLPYKKIAARVKLALNERFWYHPRKEIFGIIQDFFGTELFVKNKKLNLYIDTLGRERLLPIKSVLQNESYYLPYIAARDFGGWFDSLGNLLTILTGMASMDQSEDIVRFIKKYELAKPYPIKVIYPPIMPNDRDWRYYYHFGDLNLPDQYHNGGIWPFVGGFYVAALVKMARHKEAYKMLSLLAEMNKRGRDEEWEFNEWFHGKSGEPRGIVEQAWSAGMYIYAYECVKQKRALFF